MILGIMGGMGPAATCNLFAKIIEFTDAVKDQEHLHIVIDNNTQIPDRTQFISGFGEDPRIEMIRSILKLEAMGADYIAIPCNTAHYFYDDLVKYSKVKIINMIYETAVFLKETKPDINEYMLFATIGTYISGIYSKVFSDLNLKIKEPDEKDKHILMDWIYRVKSSKYNINKLEFDALTEKYVHKGDIPIILGCTELPLLAKRFNSEINFIDPASILAKFCVKLGQEKK